MRASISIRVLSLALALVAFDASASADMVSVEGGSGRLDADATIQLLNSGALRGDPRLVRALQLVEPELSDANTATARIYGIAARLNLAAFRSGDGSALARGKRVIESGLAVYPKLASLYESLVSFDLAVECEQCAQDDLSRMIAAVPEDPLTKRTMGRMHMRRHDAREAIPLLKSALGAGPDYAPINTYDLLAQAYAHVGPVEAEVDALTKAFELAPENGPGAGKLAEALLYRKGDFEAAARYADIMLASEPNRWIVEIRALAEYGRWSKRFEHSPGAADTAAALERARGMLPDALYVFQRSCTARGTSVIGISLLRSHVVEAKAIDTPSARGETCLNNAVMRSDIAFLELLIGAGADIDSPDARTSTARPPSWAW